MNTVHLIGLSNSVRESGGRSGMLNILTTVSELTDTESEMVLETCIRNYM